jgi:large subunit ribosomal protein L29
MKINDIREFSKEELQTRILETKKNIFNLKFQKASGQLDDLMKIKKMKKDVARIETVLREKELGIAVEVTEKKKPVKKAKSKSSQTMAKPEKTKKAKVKEKTVQDK